MLKKILLIVVTSTLFISTTTPVFADLRNGQNKDYCNPGDCCSSDPTVCKDDGTFECMPSKLATGESNYPDGRPVYQCLPSTVGKIFGKIKPPPPLVGFLKNDSTGASAISQFLSNFVTLLFSIAAIALIFMILWGAFDWLTSGGDKEKLANAQKRIINAFIGIILFATAFAIIRVVGTFTGFTFFAGQNGPADPRCTYNNCGNYGDCANYLNTTCKKFSTAPGDCTCGP